MRIHAPAKVNLALRILGREDSGFHHLETLFVSLELGDTVVLKRTTGEVTLHIDGPSPCPEEENLAYRAAQAFFECSEGEGGVNIRLEKRVPARAGLGGGSSDGAAVLKGLQSLFPGRVSSARLQELAGTLGSDVPFFLSPSPFALGWGRGDRLLPLPALPSAWILLAFPPVEMDTAEAYGMIDRRWGEASEEGRSMILAPECFSSWGRVAAIAHNDFEEVVLTARPVLASIREAMAGTSPLLTLLAGSGATLFALYPRRAEALAGRKALEEAFPDTRFVVSRTREGVADPILEEGVEP